MTKHDRKIHGPNVVSPSSRGIARPGDRISQILNGQVNLSSAEVLPPATQPRRPFRAKLTSRQTRALSNKFRAKTRTNTTLNARERGHLVELMQSSAQREEILEQLATRDELTGLWNRKGFSSLLSKEVTKLGRISGGAVTLAFVDLDGFKAINDTFGHDAGDLVLREVAEHLQKAFRDVDVIGRWGGDEIVIMMPYEEGHRITMEALRSKVDTALAAGLVLSKDGELYPLGASIGFSSTDEKGFAQTFKFMKGGMPGAPEQFAEQMIKAADSRMYFDKWYMGHKDSLPKGKEDPGHPKNKRLELLKQQSFDGHKAELLP